MNSPRPRLRDYELLIQLGHTSDYQAYLARRFDSGQLHSLWQSRQEVDPVDTAALEVTLRGLSGGVHPNLPCVADFGVEDGHLFWVSDYVEGDLLDTLGRRSSQIPTEIALRLSLDVAAALDRLGQLGGAGPVLRSDVHVGVDGVARLIPPLGWRGARRREQVALGESLREPRPALLYLCAFLWESLAGVGLTACREETGWPPISTLGVQVTPALDALLSDVLHGRARFEQVTTLASVIEQSADGVAARAAVRDWMLGLIKARLEGRAQVLRSRSPAKPSGEIPLVRVPVNLDAVRLEVTALHAGGDTERPAPLPTIPTPQPSASEAEEPIPPSTEQVSESGVPDGISAVPPSSVRSSSGSPHPARRAPLENALAEYAERASSPGQGTNK